MGLSEPAGAHPRGQRYAPEAGAGRAGADRPPRRPAEAPRSCRGAHRGKSGARHPAPSRRTSGHRLAPMSIWPFRLSSEAARAPLPEVVSGDGFLRGQIDGRMKAAVETGRNRLVVGGVLFAVAFGAIAVRLVDLAMQRPADAAGTVAGAISDRLSVKRADIVDRNGVLMASSLTMQSLI